MAKKKGARNIGIKGIVPPKKECNDKNCPFHGNLKVRGRIFEGTVKSAKMTKSVVVEWERIKYVPKYERYLRKRSKVVAHNPPCINAKEGDKVIIMECRKLSKTKSFVVLSVKGGKK